ncbi:MAG: LysM peptidoglycan-binding domain-containing protein [Proteobacteria bacterium]|nr:LysM peptidoglycan-binding domain-containing protein [Pseudomonadota bacterium]
MQELEFSFAIDLRIVCFLLAGLLWLAEPTLAQNHDHEPAFLHRVAPGESLYKIARRYLALTEAYRTTDLIRTIRDLNGISGDLIRPNQYLKIPMVRSKPILPRAILQPKDFEAKGIYVNRYSMASQKMNRLINQLIDLEGNTVILDGKDMSGKLSYPSRVNLAQTIGATSNPVISDPAKVFHYLHQKGLHVVVRLVLFYDPLLAKKRPELAVRSISTGRVWREKGIVAWVDPSQPAVQRYNLDIARELVAMGVDEIQFDYIRFPAMGDIQDAGYSFDEERISKHEIITSFLSRARKELAFSKVLLSVDVFGIAAWNRPEDIQITGQRIDELARHCDVLSPMIYPSHFYGRFQAIPNPGDHPFLLVSETCKRISSLTEGTEVTLRPWIQAFPYRARQFDEMYVLEELHALSKSSAKGWLLWSAGNAYETAWKALAQWNSRSSPQNIPDNPTSSTGGVTALRERPLQPLSGMHPAVRDKEKSDNRHGVLDPAVPDHEKGFIQR